MARSRQVGIIRLPSSTPWLHLTSDALTFVSTDKDPALDYTATACGLDVMQDGNTLTGLLCGRAANVEF